MARGPSTTMPPLLAPPASALNKTRYQQQPMRRRYLAPALTLHGAIQTSCISQRNHKRAHIQYGFIGDPVRPSVQDCTPLRQTNKHVKVTRCRVEMQAIVAGLLHFPLGEHSLALISRIRCPAGPTRKDGVDVGHGGADRKLVTEH